MASNVTPAARLGEDLCVVSSDYILLRRWVRDSFQVELGVEELAAAESVDGLCTLIRRHSVPAGAERWEDRP